MNARRIPLALFPDISDFMRFAETRQLHIPTALDTLETCVKEAKNVVHQTEVKMEELEKSMDETKAAKKT